MHVHCCYLPTVLVTDILTMMKWILLITYATYWMEAQLECDLAVTARVRSAWKVLDYTNWESVFIRAARKTWIHGRREYRDTVILAMFRIFSHCHDFASRP